MLSSLIQSFPTTHVLVDDNLCYLRGMSTILPLKNRLFRYYSDPQKALQWINQEYNEEINSPDIENIFSREHIGNCYGFDVGYIRKTIYNKKRFNRVSTVLVDYDMPLINGIEFCRSIKNPYTQKILLTGFLGEKDARNALNKGWIDMFLPKGEDSSQKITELIEDANKNYFAKANSLINSMLMTGSQENSFFSDKANDFISDVVRHHNAIELHMLNIRGDYLLVDENGISCGLSMQDFTRRRENIELAVELGVPKKVLNKLKDHTAIFCIDDQDELPHGKLWQRFIYPAICLDKDKNILGTFGKDIFYKTDGTIQSFAPIFDQSVSDAIAYFGTY